MNDNFNILKAESLIEQAVTDLPVGTAYYILRAKMFEIQKLYYEQARNEYAAVQSETAQDQDNVENELDPAHDDESD